MDTATRGDLTAVRRHLRSALHIINEIERRDRLADQIHDHPTTRAQSWSAFATGSGFATTSPEEPTPPAPAPNPWEEPDIFSADWYARHPEMQCVTVVLRVRGGQTSPPDIRIYPGDSSPIHVGQES